MEIQMNTTFKTALLAATIATACGSAYAGDTMVEAKIFSLEGTSSVADSRSASISYLTAAAYTLQDTVTFTFTAGALKNTTEFPAQINVASVATAGSELAGMTLGILTTSADSVTYRVTNIDQPTGFASADASTLGQTIVLGEAPLNGTSIAAGNVSVEVTSATGTGLVLDNGSSSGESRIGQLTEVKSQFGAVSVTTDFDAVIDVEADRKAYESGTSDDATFAISPVVTTDWENVAAVTKTTIVLSADIEDASVVSTTAASTITYNATTDKVTIVYPSEITTDTITITPSTGTDAVVLEAQSFDLSANYEYAIGSTQGLFDFGSKSAGEWTLNGAVVNVPYMPYGNSITQILYVTNEGSQDADVTVTAFDENGDTFELGSVGTVDGKSVLAIAGPVKSALEAKGFVTAPSMGSNKVSLIITVNAEDEDISIYSAYNVNGSDRGNVLNSQYKGKEYVPQG
jgi:hypothetical protein